MSWIEVFIGFNGRLARRTYWLASLLPVAVQTLAAAAFDAGLGGPIAPFAAGVATYSIAMLNTKRLHDLGQTGWRQIVFLACLVLGSGAHLSMAADNAPLALALTVGALATALWSSWIAIQMLVFEGEPGDNRFGSPEAPVTASSSQEAVDAEVADIIARAQRSKPAPAQEPTLDDIMAAAAQAERQVPASRFGRRRPLTA